MALLVIVGHVASDENDRLQGCLMRLTQKIPDGAEGGVEDGWRWKDEVFPCASYSFLSSQVFPVDPALTKALGDFLFSFEVLHHKRGLISSICTSC